MLGSAGIQQPHDLASQYTRLQATHSVLGPESMSLLPRKVAEKKGSRIDSLFHIQNSAMLHGLFLFLDMILAPAFTIVLIAGHSFEGIGTFHPPDRVVLFLRGNNNKMTALERFCRLSILGLSLCSQRRHICI